MRSEAEREKEIADEMATCKHFNGIGGFRPLGPDDDQARWNDDKACEAGVVYREHVGGPMFGWVNALPCHGSRFRAVTDPRPVVPCAKFCAPTREEAEREVDERRAHMDDVLRRLEAGEDVPGVIICGGRTEPEGKECPQSEDGKCPNCGATTLFAIYGLGSGYGGIGAYSICHDDATGEGCGTVCDFVEDDGDE
jgi:hypothetical protein